MNERELGDWRLRAGQLSMNDHQRQKKISSNQLQHAHFPNRTSIPYNFPIALHPWCLPLQYLNRSLRCQTSSTFKIVQTILLAKPRQNHHRARRSKLYPRRPNRFTSSYHNGYPLLSNIHSRCRPSSTDPQTS
jgi:hypothetical protein